LHKTKLYKLIKSLSKREFNQLEAYIDSSFFLKKNKNPLKLYHALKEFAPKFDDDDLTKQVIFGAVFPKVKYNDAKMRNLLGKTVKIVDSYLLYLDNEGDEFGRDKRLSKVYNKRNIESEFFNYSRRLLSDLEGEKQKNIDYYFNKFSLEKEMYFHSQGKKQINLKLLESSISNFHNYISLEYINIELEVLNRRRIYTNKINLSPLGYSTKLTENNLTLEIITKIKELLINNDLNLYHEIYRKYKEQFSFLHKNDSADIYVSLQNFLSQESYTNPPLYNNLKFELNQIGIKHDLMIVNNYFLDNSYLNVVIMGIKVKKYSWVKNFIEKYQDKLHPKNAKFIKNLGLGLVYFEEKKYEEVIKILAKSKIPSVLWVQNTRITEIKSFFKLFLKNPSYYKPLLNHCGAFEKFLKRKEAPFLMSLPN